jgi:hypothetical protein
MKDPFANMDESMKTALDGVSLIATLGSLIEMLPTVSALLSIVWVSIRIFETDTVQRLFGRKGSSDAKQE